MLAPCEDITTYARTVRTLSPARTHNVLPYEGLQLYVLERNGCCSRSSHKAFDPKAFLEMNLQNICLINAPSQKIIVDKVEEVYPIFSNNTLLKNIIQYLHLRP